MKRLKAITEEDEMLKGTLTSKIVIQLWDCYREFPEIKPICQSGMFFINSLDLTFNDKTNLLNDLRGPKEKIGDLIHYLIDEHNLYQSKK